MPPFFAPRPVTFASLAALWLGVAAMPAAAQNVGPVEQAPSAPQDSPQQDGAAPADDNGQDRVNMLIVYGNDPCPKSSGNEITVCARKDESERYRIPKQFRGTPSREDESWTSQVRQYETVGATGTGSCSPVGAGGWTGCMNKFLSDAYAEKKTSEQAVFSRLIEEAREKRLSTIDADAAKTQAEVEKAEKDYDARQRAMHDPHSGDAPAGSAPSASPPATPPADTTSGK